MAEQPAHIDPVIEAVRADLLARSRLGMAKYGVGVDRTDLVLRDWLQHAYEEALDLANYLKRSILEIDARGAESTALARLGVAGPVIDLDDPEPEPQARVVKTGLGTCTIPAEQAARDEQGYRETADRMARGEKP